MKAVLKNPDLIEVTVSRRNVNRILELAEDGRIPGQMRQGDPSKNEPTVVLVMQEDEQHYTDERYVGPERDSGEADLVSEMYAVLLETDELLEVGEDPGTARFIALVDRIKARVED